MNPTLDDLRRALQDEAFGTPLPSPDALVAGATARVRAAQRRRAVVGAAVAAVVLAAGVLASTHPGRDSSQPARSGPFREVRSGGAFPAYLSGGKRLLVVSAPAAKELTGTVDVPTTPGRDLMVLPVCAPSVVFDFDRPQQFTASSPGNDQTQLGCMPEPDVPGGNTSLGPSTGHRTPVDIHMLMGLIETRSGPSFVGATVTLGFYEQLSWAEYPKPPRPAGFDTDPDQAWSAPADPKSFVLGPRSANDSNAARVVSLPATKQAREITLEIRGPGRLRVRINGTDVTEVSHANGAWLEFYDYSRNIISLDAREYSSGQAGGMLRIEVTPDGFTGPDWRVVVGRQSSS